MTESIVAGALGMNEGDETCSHRVFSYSTWKDHGLEFDKSKIIFWLLKQKAQNL